LSDFACTHLVMPRPPRCIAPGTTYHLISRFVDRAWFIRTPSERELYLRLLGNALEDSDWRTFGYAVMSNHVHFVSAAGVQPLSRWIRRVHAPFADSMNRAYSRIGCIFVRGPKAKPVAPESFPHLLAYIHNNPVRAGVCSNASDTTWTSHRAYMGIVPTPRWLHVSEGLSRAGLASCAALDAWVNDPARAETEALFHEEAYAEQERQTRCARRVEPGRRIEQIVAATADVLGVTIEALRSSRRGAQEVMARAVAARCASALGLSGRAVAEGLELSQQRVSVLLRQPASEGMHALCADVSRALNAQV
jgi:REP element-mobilizing transposase RayT